MIELERHDNVYVLAMRSGENRFNRDFVARLTGCLDEVEACTDPIALVTTGEGKFYSNGLDLEWMMSVPDEAHAFVAEVERTFARILAFPVPTVAALNGHTFAAGGMLALSHDFRVMREDRGFFCLPEADINIPFRPGMTALIRSRLTPRTAHEAMVFGVRFGGVEALEKGIVDACASEADVLKFAIDRAAALAGKDRSTMQAIKRGLYTEVLAELEAE